MIGFLSCSICGDSWFRDLDDMQLEAYSEANPEVDVPELEEIDLGETVCDGCEDYYNDLYEVDDAES